jgi:K+-transporting ATPase ATPase C chain
MISLVRPAVVLLLMLTVLTGGLYPLVVTGVGNALFPAQAGGSLLLANGKVVGSSLIGQSFTDPQHFWGRLSATTPMAYNADGSTGSNFGPTNPALLDAARARIAALRAADPGNRSPIPVDLVTASASGLDPHISPAAALYQVDRIARARGMDVNALRKLVQEHIEAPQFRIFGESRVNVLLLNLALDGTRLDHAS